MLGICKCGAVLPGKRKLCDSCRQEAARQTAKRWQAKKKAVQRENYDAEPKRCLICGKALPWEMRRYVYCSEDCIHEAKKRRAKSYAKPWQTLEAAQPTGRKGTEGAKAPTLRQTVRELEAENARRRAQGQPTLTYGQYVAQMYRAGALK